MKVISVLLLILGTIGVIVGILPFIFDYPYSDGPNSGPSNMWELILMVSYEGKGWYLILGLALVLLSMFLLFKPKQLIK
ncbi:hypothetical protein [Paenibacillus sp. GCM10027626]|uniref:hypothetical protein n=1 Tax=Paenibacillus sp. GCM10027626 TaxID=3273411 RepID=UPI00364104DE